ncbi:MAG: zinc-ribbon domain-containing protein [Deltaproteobacteria bacterium]|nr:zinc-ribbon domain-containing protein [Deltaproteobacteria bacterium]
MIVTCPGCSSKYRVRNESVPADGARMRCPKCETLFLARPPVDGSTTSDDPSSQYQQLAPQGARGSTGSFAPVPPTGGGAQAAPVAGLGAPRPGPVTALFQAVDPALLPPVAPPPTPAPPMPSAAPPPSGLAIVEQPRVRAVVPPQPAREPAPSAPVPTRAGRSPSGGLGSWIGLSAGALVFLGGTLTWAWTTEALPLDAALMPVARALTSAERPGTGAHDVDQIRRAAAEAADHHDLPAAVVAWRRAKALSDASDRRPSEALAKMLVALGEVP